MPGDFSLALGVFLGSTLIAAARLDGLRLSSGRIRNVPGTLVLDGTTQG
jgi:hypothetical protein